MATLTLSSREQEQVLATQQVLLSPLNYSDTMTWCAEVTRLTKALVGGDMSGTVLPGETRPLICAADYGSVIEEYPDRTDPLQRRLNFLARAVRLGAYDRGSLWGPDAATYFSSAYYNEWIVPNRYFDAIGIAYPTSPRIALSTVAQLLVHHDSQRGPRFGTRELALLRLLLPVFRAGVETSIRLGQERVGFARTLDSLAEAILLCDVEGRVLHANVALRRLVATDPEGERLQLEMEHQARQLAKCLRGKSGVVDGVSLGKSVRVEARTSVGRYRLRGSFVGQCRPQLERDPGVLIVAERITPAWPSELDLVERFGLTAKQAQAALLVAAGKSDLEIAAMLCIRPSTARNHVAQVRLKLGVTSRSKVALSILTRTDLT